MHLKETSKRIEKWMNGEPQLPTKIDMFITERCNLKCKFCNYHSSSPKKELTDLEVSKLISQICEMDIRIFGIL